MKKTVLFAAALVATTVVNAQTGEITSNRGENWLSQDGDWGLTIDATPFLNYAGNLFNGTSGNSAPTWGTPSNALFDPFGTGRFTIAGKKLIDANTAYRGKLRLGFGSVSSDTIVASTTTPNAFVTDTQKDGGSNIALGFGLEKRVGSTRVVGVYGAEAMIGLASSKTTFEYGNAIDANNPAPRATEIKQGGVFSLGVMAFAGVEWFCAPKMSLGAEYNWGIAFSSQGEGSGTVEFWNGTAVESQESNSGGSSSFGIDTGSNGASINLNFYFQ
ncbi:MAG: hypothetical protein JNL05_15170 [Flavobacteriales bacterium]|nr:hypothetical protein [Flavobacteriales bacterium]